MFGFRVTYLRGSVTAADIRTGNEKDRVEWPPHPDRLFCALVQAWGDLGARGPARSALLWLEGLPPPLIRCGEILTASVVARFVPVNDTWNPVRKGKGEPLIAGSLIGRRRQPRRIPTATLNEDEAVFWWADATPSPDDHANLVQLSAAVASLGHSSCLVAVEVINEAGTLVPTWAPHANGTEALRIPGAGRLSELCEAYGTTPRRRAPTGSWATYGEPSQEREIPRGHHRDLVIFRLVSDSVPLPLESASLVVAVWRKALLQKADQPVCEAISGHAPESTSEAPKPSQGAHLALLPLGDVGHRYARSHLLGLAAALPAALSPDERQACLRALGRVDSLALGRLGVWRLVRCASEESRAALRPATWSRPACVWATVTPFVFGKYPRALWGDEAAALVSDACIIAGLPRPSQVATAPVAWVLGAPPAGRFADLPHRPGKPRRLQAHVRLVFPEAVAGPVLVGAGRHQGYGLFRQLTGDAG